MKHVLFGFFSCVILTGIYASSAFSQGAAELENRTDKLISDTETPTFDLPFGATGDGKTGKVSPVSFSVSLPLTYKYDSNIFQRDFATDDDTIAIFSPSAGVRYAVDPTTSLSMSVNAGVIRYNEHSAFDLDTLSGVASAAKKIDDTVLQVSYQRLSIYTPGFDDRRITFDRPQIAVQQNNIIDTSGECILGSSTCDYNLSAKASLRRSTSPDTSAGDNWRLLFAPTLVVTNKENRLSLSVGASIADVWYDNVDRNDLYLGAAAGLRWSPLDNVSFSASFDYSNRDSDIDVLDYSGYGLSSSAGVSIKF